MEEGMESEAAEVAKGRKGSGGKKKRGRPTKAQMQPSLPLKKKKREEEEVCFICFDGGNLVVCDRRNCPKVYHPSCVNRDEAFFRSKGRWNCGWHICSICEKTAHFMCYTCTYSLCKGCIKESGFSCVRGNKGLCETCMRTVMLIETNEPPKEGTAGVDFNDKNSWEYLFKDYWLDLKGKLCLNLEEVTGARNPFKGSAVSNEESSDENYEAKNDLGSSSDNSLKNIGGNDSRRKKVKRKPKSSTKREGSVKSVSDDGTSAPEDTGWASKELLDFVGHMKNGDKSVLSQFDVQALLLEYIKRNNLRDPRRKSQIICDVMLENLFGKARVGHFEMLKLLESHFLIKETSQVSTDDTQGDTEDTDALQMGAEENSDTADKSSSERRRKGRKKIDEKESQSNIDDYAAIDTHNINLIYLRRNLVEELLDDVDEFQSKVVGTFVRIRISGSAHKQDMYRLVQVVGTGKAAEKYKTGKRSTDITLEILNLNKMEVVTIDTISNQDFTEEECKRLRQSIKCGLISRLTVGEVQEKARALQAVRVNDWLETEKLRLGHLRDRASEKGRRKEHRECVEKLQLLCTPEERSRRLNEIPDVHSDPNMDPNHESADEDEDTDDKKRESYMKSRGMVYPRKSREFLSPGKGELATNDGRNGARRSAAATWDSTAHTPSRHILEKGDPSSFASDQTKDLSWNERADANRPNSLTSVKSGVSPVVPKFASAPALNVNENDKIWHYLDPSGKIQGPFSMTQLRKWNTTGFFPADHKIWRNSEKQEDAILLSDALVGRFEKVPPQWPAEDSFQQTPRVTLVPGSREISREVDWRVNNHPSPNVKMQNDASWRSNGNNEGVHSTTVNERWANQSLGYAASKNDISPKDSSGRSQDYGSRSLDSYSGRSNRHPVRDDSGGNSGRSNAEQNRGNALGSKRSVGPVSGSYGYEKLSSPGSSGHSPRQNWRPQLGNDSMKDWTTSGKMEALKISPGGRGTDPGWRNDLPSPSTPTPRPKRVDWVVGSSLDSQSSISPAVPENDHPRSLPHEAVISDVSRSGAAWSVAHDLMVAEKQPLLSSSSIANPGEKFIRVDAHLPAEASGLVGQGPNSSSIPVEASDVNYHNTSQRSVSNITVPDPISIANWASPADTKSSECSLPSPTPITKLPSGDFSPVSATVNRPNNQSIPTGVPHVEPATQSNTGLPVGGIGTPNTSWGPNTAWGMGPQQGANGNLIIPGHGNANIGLGMAAQGAPPNAVWGTVPLANTNQNPVWGTVMQGNPNAGWAGTINMGNPNSVVAAQGNTNSNVGWATTQGNPNTWDASAGNSQMWRPQQKQGEHGSNVNETGHGSRPSWKNRSSGGRSSRPSARGHGICKFHESGHCKKGASCNYLHN
ncbi:Zinc finger CCCH domain-containing protein 19 [Acorus calamus]|uniref:Zinc finger CCCH domain-containing protein 19 n=1 Tax=Acorus calamus TaxID=4465 RepID=A0AAV9DQ04_ACOCL|nr:Zinc finger CCCH domain-containing protein 19 [Acorus calamus]